MPRRPRLRPCCRAADLCPVPASLRDRGRHPRAADRGSRTVRPRLIRPSAPAVLLTFLALAPHGAAGDPVPPSDIAPPPAVESVSPTGYRVRVPVGEARVTDGRVFGFDLADVTIPGGSVRTAWGEPALPTRIVLLRVPWGAVVEVRGARRGVRSLGALSEALSGPAYRVLSGVGESPAVVRAIPMASGDERLLAVTLAPVLWD